jgi:hypothetical protein
MNDGSLYKSKRTAKSLWQQYRIYRDRLSNLSLRSRRITDTSRQASARVHGLNGTGCRIRMIR